MISNKNCGNTLFFRFAHPLNVFTAEIPRAIRIAETSAYGLSIFEYDPKRKAAEAFEALVEEVV